MFGWKRRLRVRLVIPRLCSKFLSKYGKGLILFPFLELNQSWSFRLYPVVKPRTVTQAPGTLGQAPRRNWTNGVDILGSVDPRSPSCLEGLAPRGMHRTASSLRPRDSTEDQVPVARLISGSRSGWVGIEPSAPKIYDVWSEQEYRGRGKKE